MGSALPHPRICILNGSKILQSYRLETVYILFLEMTYYRLKITFLLLALEDVDALRILQRQTIRTQIVDGEGILVKQELTIQNLP